MTYAIGEIVYGLDLSKPGYRGVDKWEDYRGELEELIETEGLGFGSAYSGSGDSPEWFGVESQHGIDECDAVDGEWLIGVLTVTEEVKKSYQVLLDGLDAIEISDELKAAIKATEPKMWILWGSS